MSPSSETQKWDILKRINGQKIHSLHDLIETGEGILLRELKETRKKDTMNVLQDRQQQCGIIGITEAHLAAYFTDSKLFSSEKAIYSKDNNLHGGSVLVAIDVAIPPKVVVSNNNANIVSISFN